MAESLTSIVLTRHLHSLSESKRGEATKDRRELARYVLVTPLSRLKPTSAMNDDEKPKLSLTPTPYIEKAKVSSKTRSHAPSVALPSVSPQLFHGDLFFPSSNSQLSTRHIPLRRNLLNQTPGTRSARGGGFSYFTKQSCAQGFLQHKPNSLLKSAFHGQVTGKRMLKSVLAWKRGRKSGETELGSDK